MKVRELIEELNKFDGDLEVRVRRAHTMDRYEVVGTPVHVIDLGVHVCELIFDGSIPAPFAEIQRCSQ